MRKGDEKAWEEFAKRVTDSLQKNKANNSCYGADSSQKISKPNTKCRNLITTTAYFSFPFKRNTNTIIGCFKHAIIYQMCQYFIKIRRKLLIVKCFIVNKIRFFNNR